MEGANEEDLSDRKDSQRGDCEWLCAQPMIDLREPAALHWGVAVFSGGGFPYLSLALSRFWPLLEAPIILGKTPRILPSSWKVLIFYINRLVHGHTV